MVKQHSELPSTWLAFIWHFLSKFKAVVAIYVGLVLLAGLWGPINSLLVKTIINLLPQVKHGDVSVLVWPASLVVVNFIVTDNVTWRGIGYIRCQFVPVIINRIIGQTMDHVLGHSHQFYQNNLSGKISKQVGNLADAIEQIFMYIAANFLRGLSLLVSGFVITYFVHPIFFYVLFAWFVLFAGVSVLMSKKLVVLADKQAAAESEVIGELVDTVSNQSNVRIFARRHHENTRINPFLKCQQKRYHATYYYSLIMNVIQGAMIAVMMGFSAYFLIQLYAKNLVTVGDFALIFGLCMETGHMMWFTMEQVDAFNRAVGKCKQSLSALMVPVEVQDVSDAVPLKCSEGGIVFDKVNFHYKGSDALFQDKSIAIEPGQKIGLVGYSGGGKSTFANLILRFYDVTGGAIYIDGQDISQVTQDSLHESIAMIPQDPSLFHRSLMDNIRYGRMDATDDEVIEAAKKAHAHDFIGKLAQGYDSLVGERGVKLSGGQRQRIAIARAILKNAPILILDEATSQLDSVTERLIQDSLWELMQGKTTIVIAHRLSTLLHMDRILVFDKGQIVEDGTHNALLANQGLYKVLWGAQVGGFLGDKTKGSADNE